MVVVEPTTKGDVMFDIADMPLFAGLTTKELGRIRGMCTGLRVPPGTSLAQQGATGRECVLVCAGSIAVERDDHTIAELHAGDVFGEIALLAGGTGRRNASGRTTSECDVLVFTPQEFRQLLDEHPQVAARLERTAIERLVAVPAAEPL